jgi:hypothetical protein
MPPSYSSGPPSGIETLSPGSTRRRVFVAPDLKSHAIAVLTFSRLYLGDPNPVPPDPELVDAIENGGANIEKSLGSRHVHVDLPFVKRVKLDVPTATITLEYAALGMIRSVSCTFSSAEPAEAMFGKLWRRLGDDEFDLKQDKPEPWAAVQLPLIVGLAILIASVVTGVAGYVDWVITATVGGIGLAAAAAVGFARLNGKATRLELIRK